MLKYGIEGQMVKVTMLISAVVIEVDEIFDVVVGADVLDILLLTCYGHAHHLVQTGSDKGLDWCTILELGREIINENKL